MKQLSKQRKVTAFLVIVGLILIWAAFIVAQNVPIKTESICFTDVSAKPRYSVIRGERAEYNKVLQHEQEHLNSGLQSAGFCGAPMGDIEPRSNEIKLYIL